MKHKRFTVVFLLMIALAFALSDYDTVKKDSVNTITKNREDLLSEPAGNSQTIQTARTNYSKNGVKAEYPKIISGGSKEELDLWNQIIEQDFNKILKLYSFEPETGPSLVPEDHRPVILNIGYDLTRADQDYISILYTAAYNSPYSAHPTELIYTTNIDKANGSRIRLKDMVKLDKAFVTDFRTWKFNQSQGQNKDYIKAIEDYVLGLSDEDLLKGFESADIIGSGNRWGIYSYLDKDRLGISLGAPNYIGDHVEFEKEYSKLGKYLKSGI